MKTTQSQNKILPFAGAVAAGSTGLSLGGLLGGSSGILGGIMSGISSIFGGRSRRREQQRQQQHDLALARLEGEETRRTIEYQDMLQRQNLERERARRSGGFQTYVNAQRSGALASSRLPSLQRMLAHGQQQQNPAAATPEVPPPPAAAPPSNALGYGGGSPEGRWQASPYANFVQR